MPDGVCLSAWRTGELISMILPDPPPHHASLLPSDELLLPVIQVSFYETEHAVLLL